MNSWIFDESPFHFLGYIHKNVRSSYQFLFSLPLDTHLSTSTFGSAFIAASRTLGSRCGSAAGENGLLGLVVMYCGDAFLNSPVLVAYVTRLDEENESPVVCSSIAENTWFWPNVTIFGEPGPVSSSLISSGTMSAGCGDRGGELGSGLDVSTVCVVPTGAKDTTETTCSAATASSVSWAITLSVCSITCRKLWNFVAEYVQRVQSMITSRFHFLNPR